MKKTITIIAAIALAAALLVGCGAAATKPGSTEESVTQNPMAAPAVQNSAKISQQTEPILITLEQAKAIALKDAGVTAADATFTKTRQERDDGMPEFEIDFIAGGWEYDYTIHAETGDILEREKEPEYTRAQSTAPAANTQSGSQTSKQPQDNTQPASQAATAVNLEKAKSIALEHAGVRAADATFTKARQEYDDGVLEYEVDFNAGGWEYDYSIHAGTGRILEFEKEPMKNQRNNGASTTNSPYSAASDVSLARAKEIALKHAGLSANQVRFTKAELDYDDGIAEYEIEFRYNGWEYEYTIHAGTGAVLEWDKDD